MFKIKSIQNNIKSFFLLLLSVLLLNSSIFAQIPSGYYNNANGLSGLQLKTALYNIIKNHTSISYTNLYTSYQTTDNLPPNKVWDMYSLKSNGTANYYYTHGSNQCGSYSTEGDCYNREHSTPSSWFSDATPMYTDLFNVYPTDGYVNNRRSNYPLANVGSVTWTSSNGSKLGNCSVSGYTGIVFEPIDSYKGDFARSYFYMATRYENLVANWPSNSPQCALVYAGNNGLTFNPWYVNMLLLWCALDPVSQKEIDRNNAVYAIQHNRNPYIDHPEYITYIWGGTTPLSTEPSNYPTNFSAKNIHLQWVDANGGVLPDRYLIRMSTIGFSSISTPADGVVYPDNANDENINYGVQTAFFKNLNSGTTYYFKLFSYTLNGGIPDYKTDGNIPEISKTLP